jgi:hypothetical protein
VNFIPSKPNNNTENGVESFDFGPPIGRPLPRRLRAVPRGKRSSAGRASGVPRRPLATSLSAVRASGRPRASPVRAPGQLRRTSRRARARGRRLNGRPALVAAHSALNASHRRRAISGASKYGRPFGTRASRRCRRFRRAAVISSSWDGATPAAVARGELWIDRRTRASGGRMGGRATGSRKIFLIALVPLPPTHYMRSPQGLFGPRS